MRSDLDRLKAGQLADARDGLVDPEAHAGELTAGSWRLGVRRWFASKLDDWMPFLEKMATASKYVATIVGAIGVVVGFIWRASVYYRTHRIAPAQEPPSDVASTFLDRVDPPRKPE